MAMISLDKVGVARQQIDCAIRLLGASEPVAVHTLASAAFRILSDLAEKSEDNVTHKKFKGFIKPGMEKDFWQAFNEAWNYMKHADTDPEATLTFDEMKNDSLLFYACLYYNSLDKVTDHMIVLISWFTVRHPECIPNGLVRTLLPEGRDTLPQLDRSEELRQLKDLLLQHCPTFGV